MSAVAGLTVHPAAAMFPMLADDDLGDLAADIAANGLLHPIVLSADGATLIDGRNRLAACERADVEPRFERLAEDVDEVAYIVSTNIARRHLTKGQQAMTLARVRHVHSVNSVRDLGKENGVSAARISQANVVIQYAPDLAGAVTSGALALNEAYERAQDRKRAARSAEAHMATLRHKRPDLAEQVAEERMTLVRRKLGRGTTRIARADLEAYVAGLAQGPRR